MHFLLVARRKKLDVISNRVVKVEKKNLSITDKITTRSTKTKKIAVPEIKSEKKKFKSKGTNQEQSGSTANDIEREDAVVVKSECLTPPSPILSTPTTQTSSETRDSNLVLTKSLSNAEQGVTEGVKSENQGGSTPVAQPLCNTSEYQHGYVPNHRKNHWRGSTTMWSQEQKIKRLEAEVESLKNVS